MPLRERNLRRAFGPAAFFVCACFGASALAQDEGGGAVAAHTLDGFEQLADAAKPWLKGFERWVETGENQLSLLPIPLLENHTPSFGGAIPDRFVKVAGRGFSAQRSGATSTVLTAKELRSSLLGPELLGRSVLCHTKVIANEPGLPGQFTLVVRVEVDDAADRPEAQSRGTVRIHFLHDDGVVVGAGGISLTDVERTSVSGPLLVDKTAAVLRGDPAAAGVLAVGMDRWAQRLDDPGLTAWFGHQGLAVGDANGDGWDDLYVAMPSGIPNQLLVSQADGTVRDMAEEASVAWLDDTKGVLFVDVNGDGRDDIVSALGHVIVVQYGDGKGHFQIGGFAPAPDETPFYGISATDFDKDGDLDLYGVRYVTSRYGESLPVPFHEARNGPSNHFFRNTERGFLDVTAPIGLRENGGGRFSLAGHFVDYDGDGDDDLYVVNDFGSNQLYEFSGGRFSDQTAALGVADPGAGMGASWSDFDADGDLDLYVTNMYSSAGRRVAFQEAFAAGRGEAVREGIQRLSLGNTLLRRDEGGFVDVADASGTRMGRWAWGAAFVDLNGDGRDDLVSPCGFLTGPKPGDL